MTLFEGQLWSDVDYSNVSNLQNLLKNNAYKLSIFKMCIQDKHNIIRYFVFY